MLRATPADVRLDTSLETLIGRSGPQDGAEAPAGGGSTTGILGAGILGAGVLATVVATAGSTYRKPGARMLILADGSCRGLLSGGCLEADLGLHARDVMERGVARAVEYDMRGPDEVLFGLGAGCEGAMRVLLEPAGAGSLAAAALTSAAGATRRGVSTSLVAVHESATSHLGTYALGADLPVELLAAAQRSVDAARSHDLRFDLGGAPCRAFVQFLAPPPHLLVCGAGPDAQPVAAAAVALGWRVSLVDHRPAYAEGHRFPGAWIRRAAAGELCNVVDVARCHAAIVMSHHLPSDVAYLRALARAGVPDFVGLLGPRSRRQRIVEELGDDSLRLQSRIRGPVGLDIGAVTPDGIALSIISQIHAWLAGRPGAASEFE